MDNLNDLKAVWFTAKTSSLPNSAEIVRIIKKYRTQKLWKLTAVVFTACVLLTAMIMVVFIYKSALASTRIGEALLILSAIILVATNLHSLNRFRTLKACSNAEFIKFLEQTRLRQLFYYKRTQVAGLIFCSAGLLLYLYEGVYQNFVLCVTAYTLTILYVLVLWLVIRPRVFRKGTIKLNEKIEKLKAISNQF